MYLSTQCEPAIPIHLKEMLLKYKTMFNNEKSCKARNIFYFCFA